VKVSVLDLRRKVNGQLPIRPANFGLSINAMIRAKISEMEPMAKTVEF